MPIIVDSRRCTVKLGRRNNIRVPKSCGYGAPSLVLVLIGQEPDICAPMSCGYGAPTPMSIYI